MNNQTNCCTYFFGNIEGNMDLSGIHLAVRNTSVSYQYLYLGEPHLSVYNYIAQKKGVPIPFLTYLGETIQFNSVS